MQQNRNRNLMYLLVGIVLVLLLSYGASLIQSNNGTTNISIIEIQDSDGNTIVGKLYQPDTATSSNPSSAALLLHGLNNDKDTQAPLAIELSKRGIVVLAIDEFNHGDSDNVGSPLAEEPSDLGAIAAFDYLGGLSYVDDANIALVGHSMGGFSANQTALARPSHKAIIFQAFGPLNLTQHDYFNNYLQIWPRYEESSFTSREVWIAEGTATITYNVESRGDQLANPVYGTTYGDFGDGSAHRYALIDSTHPGGTWKSDSITESVSWLLQALEGENEATAFALAEAHSYYLKELLTLTALLVTILSIIPLAYLLLDLEFFKSISKDLSDGTYYEGAAWWRLATINALIGGITYVLFPFIGVVLFGAIHNIIPIFGLLIGNAFVFWFLINAVIAFFIHRRWKNKQEDITKEDLGGVANDAENRWEVILKSALLAGIVMGVVYLIAGLIQLLFTVELRYMWAVFRLLRFDRLLTMIPYILLISLFFLVNGGAFLFGQARPMSRSESLGQTLKWTGLNIFNMLSMIVMVFFIEYLPMILLGTGPLLGGFLEVFWLLGIFLMQIIPEFIILFFLMTLFYNKTGRYYFGSFLATIFVVMVMINGAFI